MYMYMFVHYMHKLSWFTAIHFPEVSFSIHWGKGRTSAWFSVCAIKRQKDFAQSLRAFCESHHALFPGTRLNSLLCSLSKW